MTQAFNMDCMDAMREFPDKFFDLAIVDPPYGIGEGNKKNLTRNKNAFGAANNWVKSKDYGGSEWDSSVPSKEYFNELFRVSREQIIWGANHFGNMPPSSCWIVWDKDNGDCDQADCELAWASFKTAVRKFKFKWQGLLQQNMKNKENRIHPTQKPRSLYYWLLKNYADPGMKILDTHLGSGSSRIAAHDLGFDFWGYETDAEHFAAQEKRFAQHISQTTIFSGH